VFKYISKVLYALSGSRKHLIFLMLIFISTSVLEALGIGLIGPFISIASDPEYIIQNQWLSNIYSQLNLRSLNHFIAFLGLIIAVVFTIKSIVYFFARAYIIKFSFDQKGRLCSRLLSAYLSAPYTFHISKNTSTLINNIVVETNKFCNQCLLQILQATSNLVITIVLLILLFKTSALFLGMLLLAFLPLILTFQLIGKKTKIWGKRTSESQKEIIKVINHSLGGFKETRIIGCEPHFEEQMAVQTQILENSATLFQSSQLLPRIMLETALVISIVLFVSVFVLRSEQGVTHDITSVLGVFAVASIRLIPSTSQFFQAVGNLQVSAYALDMLYFDLKEIEKLNISKNFSLKTSTNRASAIHSRNNQIVSFNSEIDLRCITYCYPQADEAAIKNVSLKVNKGESVAFIGKSGSGKTTLVDIILGLLEPERGDISVDGVSIYYDLRAWQNLIGYIPQSIFLIDDTIEGNIAFGVPSHLVDSKRLEKAIYAAQLNDLIRQLPHGVQTYVGERGVKLSGGQRQRIGIARALYHEREILVLDEATSALDHQTENLVTEAIKSLSGQKTMIIIAHRLSTIEHCNHVYVMEDGKVVQAGSYEEIVSGKV
jgi:ABC-type multidrug transport system fused ATPase/permease subunit